MTLMTLEIFIVRGENNFIPPKRLIEYFLDINWPNLLAGANIWF